MTRVAFEHALLVGKFYPPHLGHEYVIRTALRHSRRVTVAVLASSAETIPLQARVRWLRESFSEHVHARVVGGLDDVPIDYNDPVLWQLHVDIMRQALRRADAEYGQSVLAVDAIFSSEAYGAELARRFDAAHVCLDPLRALYPVSGTAVRRALPEHWQLLPRSVRAGLAARVVVLGAESTGTTTLTSQLSDALRARGGVWSLTRSVAEFGREYSANLLALARARNPAATPRELDWLERDFIEIAIEQTRREEHLVREGGPVLLCDTDAFATCIWHERYRGSSSARLVDIAAGLPSRALYILTDHVGVPFEDDGLRDGEALRPWMTERFQQALLAQSTPWLRVNGPPAARLEQALLTIDAILGRAFTF